MKHNCPDCGSIGSVFWFIAQPQIWKCDVCRTLLHPQEIRGLTEVTNELGSSQPALPG